MTRSNQTGRSFPVLAGTERSAPRSGAARTSLAAASAWENTGPNAGPEAAANVGTKHARLIASRIASERAKFETEATTAGASEFDWVASIVACDETAGAREACPWARSRSKWRFASGPYIKQDRSQSRAKSGFYAINEHGVFHGEIIPNGATISFAPGFRTWRLGNAVIVKQVNEPVGLPPANSWRFKYETS